MRSVPILAAMMALVPVISAGAQDLKTLAAALPAPPAAPDSIVADEIVIELKPLAAMRLELAAIGQHGFTGTPSLDQIGLAAGVHQLRQQFPATPGDAAAARGLPDLSGWYVVSFDATRSNPQALVNRYRADANIRSAEVIGIHPVYAVPNDGNYASQWHLNQASDRDMDAPEAWNIETGDASIIVAMLDTGVRYYHRDIGGSGASASNPAGTDGNAWLNLAEKNGTPGFDDDGNGYVDDWVGYDFVNGATPCWSGEDCNTIDNDPRDFNGHGTHCAGNIAAINNNGYATCSPAGGWGNGTLQPTANGVKVMAVRVGWSGSSFGQEVGYVRMDYCASGLYYAANKGARIASCSWGSSDSGGIAAAADFFTASGGLIFKAAGNSNSSTADYLCARSDVYCVAATNQSDQKASFSNYGSWVDISAPGVAILSSYHVHSDPTPDYVATIDGTSMACPLVASAAALVWSAQPTWTRAQVWDRLRTTTDNIDALNPSYVGLLGSGRVNLYNAVNIAPGCTSNAQCDDGNPCNGAEQCVAGTCQPGSIVDCNSNGIADSCDLSSGTSEDCNGNSIPDECDISGGTSADCNSNNVPDECEVDPCPPGSTLLLAFTSATTLPAIGTVQNEDIAAYDTGAGTWSLYFDGSDVGLTSFAIDALAVLAGGDLLISLDVAGTVGGVSSDDSDILRFTPTSLGATTAGSWSMYFDGSDVGLTTNDEDIDAVSLDSSGRLVISVIGSPTVTGLSGLADEDLIAFNAASLGSATSGSWSYYFDGSDVGLTATAEDVDAVSIPPGVGVISLSTLGAFSVTGLSGADEDLFDFTPATLGSSTSGSYSAYFVGAAAGVPGTANISAAEEIP